MEEEENNLPDIDAIIPLLNPRLPAIILHIKNQYDMMLREFSENHSGWAIEGGFPGKAIIPCIDNPL